MLGNADVGTLSWARAGNGRLTRRERLREIASASKVLLRTLPAQTRLRLGLDDPRALDYDIDRLPIPDSRIALDAEEECREASPGRLLNHCHRTYVWGMLLGTRDGLKPDPELLYVASMLHDLTLTDRWRDHSPMPCFAARGGLLATEWAADRGWHGERCGTLGDAISLHLNSEVSRVHGPEAQLLQAGAGLDVIGMRAWELTPATRRAVLLRHPMLDFVDGLGDFSRESRAGTRTQFLMRWVRFATLARHSPIKDA